MADIYDFSGGGKKVRLPTYLEQRVAVLETRVNALHHAIQLLSEAVRPLAVAVKKLDGEMNGT